MKEILSILLALVMPAWAFGQMPPPDSLPLAACWKSLFTMFPAALLRGEIRQVSYLTSATPLRWNVREILCVESCTLSRG